MPTMAHRDAIINGDGIEFKGDAARGADGFFNLLSEFLQMNVPWNNIDIGVDYSDEGF